jgi:Na+-translocating ferredoxin:NAD+ oxidoreductase RnfC subunit
LNEGYLIVKCPRCGSLSRLDIKSVRSDVTQCPVCLECEIVCEAIQPSIQMCRGTGDSIHNLPQYLANLMNLSTN